MTVYLVRHAQAGTQASWGGLDDTARPLTREGRHQGADIVEVLGEPGFAVGTVRSSPFRRCIETVAPLAAALGLLVQIDPSLGEGSIDEAVELTRKSWGSGTVLCSHGDVIPAVLRALQREDGLDIGRDPKCQKASIWILESSSTPRRFSSARYVPAPRAR